ncbi:MULTISPECIES: ABC transporter permease [Halomonadaceae]|jgi:ABC-2 type transport system permease protein|uniref:Transport permease protein n=2 Tax=Vreelandella TaxID=3137766 RepID=A0A7Z0NAN2_9GAMM|nr:MULTISPECIES: ABC transporter permease [Halomonas]TDV90292.1 ABC-2 type transport system permease protein [Halomonas alkaliantarctica]MBF58435.1 ABC transporter permease [Halomonas sp.]MBL1266286.1 ABC transporter permease [Halomonas sp.]MBL1270730.1 ABC transporter permease [Halomonas sp.]MBS3666831.1 ABC transporter permease [Halomonas boliviensis]|tara:strand:- start:3146 stop:3919 length:774 start_codon:yes stop_codon:yes gene_type:complete
MNATQTLIALWTLVLKEIKRFTRIWPQTLLPPSITMAMYFIIFGNLIGSRIGDMDGFSYMDFIVPGLIMMSVITNSYSNVASSFFSNKFQRSIEEMMVSPMPNWVILAGFILGGMARGLGVGLIVTIVSLFFTRLTMEHPLLTVLVVVLTSALFSIGGFINALLANKFDDISIVPTFILTPLTYLGGVFYSISMLPDFWQGVSMLNPILYMVNVFRYGFLGVSDIPVGWALAAIFAFIIVLFGIALAMLERGKGIRS